MNRNDQQRFKSLISGVFALRDKGTPTSDAMKLWWGLLAPYSFEQVSAAMAAHLADPVAGKHLPMPADIIAKIEAASPGGWPTDDEAWAICPKSDAESAVWCEEIAAAYDACKSLLPDRISARMAFKGAYARAVAHAKSQGRKPVWTVTLGDDKQLRIDVINAAVQRGQITEEQRHALLPLAPPPMSEKQRLALAAPEETDQPAQPLTQEQKADLKRRMREMLGQKVVNLSGGLTDNQKKLIEKRKQMGKRQ